MRTPIRMFALRTVVATAPAVALVTLMALSPIRAATLGGVNMPDQTTVDGKTLVLNGLGLRTATFLKVKVYVIALYLESKSTNAKEIIESDQTKRIELHFVHDVTAKELRDGWSEAFESNYDNAAGIKEEISKFNASMRDVKSGDTIVLDFSGTTVDVLDQRQENRLGQRSGFSTGGVVHLARPQAAQRQPEGRNPRRLTHPCPAELIAYMEESTSRAGPDNFADDRPNSPAQDSGEGNMRSDDSARGHIRYLVLGAVVVSGLPGCTSLGPNTLCQDRPAYNEAISSTNAEQSLAYVVKTPYGVETSLLAVSSITANVRFSAAASAQLGIGPDANFAGNLVPLSGGVTYNENPTISYVPVQGEEHLAGLLSPIPLPLLVMVLGAGSDVGAAMTALVKRINRIPSHDFLRTPRFGPDERFARVVALIRELSQPDKLEIAETWEKGKPFNYWIHDYAPSHLTDVRDLLGVLGTEGVEADGDDITLPLVAALTPPTSNTIAIQTRSVIELGRIAAAGVDVPEEYRAEGLGLEFPEPGLAGRFIRIRRSEDRPVNAAAATSYRNWWYYVAGNDVSSKAFFRAFTVLMTARMAEAAEARAAPVLTVPVSQ